MFTGREPHNTQELDDQVQRAIIAAASSVALFGGALSLITPSAQAYTNCSTYGSQTSRYGSNGSSFNSYGNGNYSTFSGTTSGGNS